ncbi:sensor histidine kinase [Streptomyces sp. CRN 30]|uniref:sensor histidine kinase n=1 Tax=Streptomyces sp. CRN 30 TaxID=3075613 RepID=UPI002A83BE0C|nr:histidine kinase [Streptomyces sp. CRN 30]
MRVWNETVRMWRAAEAAGNPRLAPRARTDRGVRLGHRVLDAVGLRGPLRRDGALAVVAALCSLGLFGLSLTGPERPAPQELVSRHAWVIAALLAGQALVLCVRRRAPLTCLFTVIVCQVSVMALMEPWDAIRTPSQFIAAATVGSVLPLGATVGVVVVAVLFETAGYVLVHLPFDAGATPGEGFARALGLAVPLVGEQIVAAVLVYGVSAMLGAQFAVHRRYTALARLREREAAENQQAREAAAVGRERARMARELHDIAAHHLSGLVIQAAVLERMIDDEPAEARRTAAWIRGQGKETLDDLRLVVGVLRGPATGDGAEAHVADVSGVADRAPAPGLAVLDHLVTTVRALGTSAELTHTGGARELPPVADVTFYRVAQEALSNVRDHAPGAAVRVTIDHRPAHTVLTVVNDAAPRAEERRAHSGYGLAGMRERAELIGAEFEAGPTADGGWRVRLALAVGPADTDTDTCTATATATDTDTVEVLEGEL